MNMPLNTQANTSDPIALARYNMIEQQIRTWNVFDRSVLDTLARVHREDFVPLAYRSMAFVDMEIPLQGDPEEAVRIGQCMLAPRVEARLLQELNLQNTPTRWCPLKSTQCWPPWPATTWSAPVSATPACVWATVRAAPSPTGPSMPSC